MEIIPFEAAHDVAAAGLVARAVRGARRSEALIPVGWEQADSYLAGLASIRKHGSGIALMDGGRMLGFLAGFEVSRERGRWIYTPEWGWAARPIRDPGMRRGTVIQDLYAAAAERWVEAGFRAHYASVLANDRSGLRAWAWLGFGHQVMDGIRDLSPPAVRPAGKAVVVRRAAPSEARRLGALEDGLRAHLAGSPVFFALGPPRSVAEHQRRIADPDGAVLFAEVAGAVVGYLVVGPSSDDAATIIRDDRTASISGAFVLAEHRRAGIADALLDAAIGWARAGDYERIAVDFETSNLLATRFWTRSFRPVTHSLVRRL